MTGTKFWQVETERYDGIALNMKSGKCTVASELAATRVRYRVAGSRGRWRKFVIEGKVPADLQKLVDAYEKAKATR